MTDKNKYRYAALLRGINVGGHSIIKMAELKKQFELIGLLEVKTYIQTGNVLFTSEEKDTKRLTRQIEQHLAKTIGYNGTVFILTPEDMKTALKHCPFNPQQNDDKQYCHIMFLSDKPKQKQVNALMALRGEEYSFAVWNKILYYAYPREYAGRRRFIDFEKVLGVNSTARSWKVVNKLIELSGE
jgi:uncharacterized protein (DUF1697 family)